jgi:hypothetical protein
MLANTIQMDILTQLLVEEGVMSEESFLPSSDRFNPCTTGGRKRLDLSF